MHLYTTVLGITLPSYSLMILTGALFANLAAFFIIKRRKADFDEFVILEAYGIMGAFAGAKALFLIISCKYIDWARLSDYAYFHQLMEGGFVFYGGLIGGLAAVFAASKIHRIEPFFYLRTLIFLVPFVHAFGRIGCFMAGCCYGVSYHGPGAVVFPEGSFAPAGTPLFPVQIAEAVCLLLISALILWTGKKHSNVCSVEMYLILYGAIRFVLEFFRNDALRGFLGPFSTSQWISIGLALSAAAFAFCKKKKGQEGGLPGMLL